MEEDMVVRRLKREKPGCNRHQIDKSNSREARLERDLFDQTQVRLKMSKFMQIWHEFNSI